LITTNHGRPFGARSALDGLTQGSPSLALALTLTAAPQLKKVHV